MARARTPRKHRSQGTHCVPLKPKLIALSVAAAFALSLEQAAANPTGPAVVSGSATFATQGNALTVTNSANAIINWQSFSIGANEATRFIQPSQLSAVLNRVVGAGGSIPQSVLQGVLSSNGHVFLLNPSGIIIGAGARIDVAGLVASSLDLSNEDFLAGRLKFNEVPGAGAVQNAGTIDTGPGGRVYLVGATVENSGIIRSPEGDVVLAAGKSIELVSETSPHVSVRVSADAEEAKNLGTIIADSGRIGIHGAIVTQGGVAEASGAVVGPGGEIRLVGTKDVNVEAGSRTAANGTEGGSVLIQAESGTARVEGTVEATGASGNGGSVQALGVRVGVLGNGIIDASGETGGGTVLVGGDYQGKNPEVQNSQQSYIGSDGVIRADARDTGNGGRVIVWSDGGTQFYGSISARGGANGGDGGFVETSGKDSLQAFGRVDVGAAQGNGGKWLLDPTTLNVVAGDGFDDGYIQFDGLFAYSEGSATSSVGTNAILAAMTSYSAVELQATQNINFNTSVDTSSVTFGTFSAYAGNNINLNGFTVAAGGSVWLGANSSRSGMTPSGTGAIVGAANVTSANGAVNLSGHGVSVNNVNTNFGAIAIQSGAAGITTANLTSTGGGSITATSSGGSVTTGNVTTRGGDVSLYASAPGAVTVNGTVDTRALTICCGVSGNVDITADANATVTGNILTRANEAPWNDGDPLAGNVSVVSNNGNVQVGGLIDTSGAVVGYASTSNWAGDVSLYGKTGVSAGDIKAVGGPGSMGGYGGWGGDVDLRSDGAVQVGSIDTRGGNASASTIGAGYAGGLGGDVTIEGFAGTGTNTSSISTGAIDVSGGSGSSGVAGTLGGDGGYAGLVALYSNATSFASITGNGGAGGAGNGAIGGDGGWAGAVLAYGLSNAGPINMVGGAAGTGGAGSLGGYGGYVVLNAPGGIALNSVTARNGTNGDGSVGNQGLLYVYANGGVSQSGALNIDSMYVDTQGAGGDVVLANTTNFVPIFTGGASPVNGAFTLVTGGIANPTASVSASGNVLLKNMTPGGTYIVNATSGSGGVSVAADSVLVTAANSPAYFEWYSPNSAPLGINQNFFNGINAPMVKVGNSMYSSPITLTGAISLPTTTLSLITGGALITQAPGAALSAFKLNADGGDVLLTEAGNQVGTLQGRAANDFQFTASGNIVLGQADPGNVTPGVVSSGFATLTSGGSILSGLSGTYDASAPVVQLSAAGSIGAPGTPLRVRATQLDASAQTGIDLVTNQSNPQLVYVTTLQNLTSGNITLSAYGGASIQNTAVNAGGDVTIRTASPLDVVSGIDAFGNILLETAGTGLNDMYLDNAFLYDPNFTVIVGPGGVLTLGPNFQGPITALTGGAPPSSGGTTGTGTAGEVLSQVSQTTGEINNSVNFDSNGGVVGGDGEQTEEEKRLPVCSG